MARVTLFSYRAGTSLLYRLDPRFKLLFMLLFSLWSLHAGFWLMCAFTVCIAILLYSSRIKFWIIFKELKLLFWFLLFIFLARILSTEGQPMFEFYTIAPTMEGAVMGVRVCWRLVFIILVSLAFVVSTTSAEIKAAIEFYFEKIPFIPEKRLSTMLGLVIRFIPLILSQIQETVDAQNARCIGMRKNPVTRLIKLTIPVLRRVFQNGDRLAVAMASRCYTDERTGPELQATPLDWTALVVLLTLYLLSLGLFG